MRVTRRMYRRGWAAGGGGVAALLAACVSALMLSACGGETRIVTMPGRVETPRAWPPDQPRDRPDRRADEGPIEPRGGAAEPRADRGARPPRAQRRAGESPTRREHSRGGGEADRGGRGGAAAWTDVVTGAWPDEADLTDAGFPIDRRPMTFVYLSEGARNNRIFNDPGPRDADGDGTPDGAEILLGMLDRMYADGVRRMWLDRASSDNYMPWYEMPEWHVRLYRDYVGPWFDRHPDVQFIIHLLPIFGGAGEPPEDINKPEVVRTRPEVLLAECAGWRDVGVDLFYLDASMHAWRMIRALNQTDLLRDRVTGHKLYVGAEAGAGIPSRSGGNMGAIPWFAAGQNGWWTIYQDAESRGSEQRFEPVDDAEASIVYYFRAAAAFRPELDPVQTMPEAYRLVRSGKVLATPETGPQYEWAKRIYEFGTINAADFDGDGEVTTADLELFGHAVTRSGPFEGVEPMPEPSFVDGDVDLDGAVTRRDLEEYSRMHAEGRSMIRFGPANRDLAVWSATSEAEGD